MSPDATFTLLPPALAVLGGMLAFAPAVIPATRQHAMTVSLAVALLSLIAAFYMPGWVPALAVLLALIIAAPLLDRARFPGLLIGTLLGMAALHYSVVASLPTFLPVVPHSLHLLLAIAGAASVGLIGSAMIPLHPAREKLRAPQGPSHWRMLGYMLLALAILEIAGGSEPIALPTVVLSALTSALLSLLWARRTHHPQPLLRTGQGVLAGILAALMLPDNQELALAAGALAALLVAQGETMAHSLWLDDPSQHLSTLLFPSLLGILLASFHEFSVLADALRWLGAALGLTVLIALALWLLIKVTIGLAAAPRRVREGLDFTA